MYNYDKSVDVISIDVRYCDVIPTEERGPFIGNGHHTQLGGVYGDGILFAKVNTNNA